MIAYKNIVKKYNNFNLNINKLELYDNKIYALLGENGAGKTTTIRMTLGLLKPTCGDILYDGKNVFREKNVKQKIGYVPDTPNLYENLTGIEQVNFLAHLYKSYDEDYIKMLMKIFNIYEDRNKKISSYSKGMKQKISVICSLIHKPEVLILDEPFTALDPEHIKILKNYIKEYIRKEKRIVLFSTHDLDVANNLCTSAVIMKQGNVINKIENIKETGCTLEKLYFKEKI